MHNSVEKLIRQNEELLRKNASLQKQGRMLVEEKSEIIKRLQLTEEANIKLTKLFKDATRQCKDLQQYQMVPFILFMQISAEVCFSNMLFAFILFHMFTLLQRL